MEISDARGVTLGDDVAVRDTVRPRIYLPKLNVPSLDEVPEHDGQSGTRGRDADPADDRRLKEWLDRRSRGDQSPSRGHSESPDYGLDDLGM